MWLASIDKTLRSTAATLDKLQERQDSYNRAKQQMDDALGSSTPHREVSAFDSLDRTDVGVPPPLPRHRPYHTSRGEAYIETSVEASSGLSPSPTLFAQGSPQPPTIARGAAGVAHGFNGRRGTAFREDPMATLELVNAKMQGAMVELELEKTKRVDSIRELGYRTTVELAELRSKITELQNENASLRKSVRALEGKSGFAPEAKYAANVSGGAQTSFLELEPSSSQQQQQLPRTAFLASAIANSGFGLTPAGSTVSASLSARVDALESAVARQQQLAENRQTSTAALLQKMVKTEVDAGVAQVRTEACQVARDGVEALLKLRLSALESSVQTDVQRALRVASASETTALKVQQQCDAMERRLSTEMNQKNALLRERQRDADSSSPSATAATATLGTVVGCAGGSASQERFLQLERVTEEELQGLRAQLRQSRLDTEAQLERLAQAQKQMQSQLQSKASAQDMRGVVERLEEEQQQRSSSGGGAAFREQVNAVLRTPLQPLQDALTKLYDDVQGQRESAEAWRRQADLRFAAVEASTKDFRDEAERLDQQCRSCVQELRQVRTDTTAAQARATDALRQCKAELMDALDAKMQATEERLQLQQRDRQQQQVEAQLRQLQQSVTEQQETAQRTRAAGDAAGERLRRVEAAVAAMESAVSHSIADAKAKHEALQTVVQQSCVLPLTRLQQDAEDVQRRLHALDEDKAHLNIMWAQQLAVAKQFFEEHVRNSRDMLEQRLSHQKELYEELRAHQTSQRRYADEQQQLVLEQMNRLQQQQQQLLLSANLAPLPMPVTKKRSMSEESSSLAAAKPEAAAAAATTITAAQGEENSTAAPPPAAATTTTMATPGAATAPSALASLVEDAIAPLQSRLHDMHEQQQLEKKDQELRRSETEHTLSEKLRAVSEAYERASASTEEQLLRLREELAASTTPLRLVMALSNDVESVRHLALLLQDHLAFPPRFTQALEDLQTQAAQHAQSLDAVQAALRETQQQTAEIHAAAEAERTAETPAPAAVETVSVSPQDVENVRAELQAALFDVRQSHDALLARQTALEKQTQQLSEERLVALSGQMEDIQQATELLSPRVGQLTEQCTALQSAQRQQLPTLQKYVQDVLAVVQESQAAALDPLQLRVRTVEEQQRQQHTHLQEWMGEQATAAEQAGLSRQKKLEQLKTEWETRYAGQLGDVQHNVSAAQAGLADLVEKVAQMERLRLADEEEKQQLREEVRAVAQAAKEDHDPAAAPPLEETSPTAAVVAAPAKEVEAASVAVTNSAAGPTVEELQSYVEELDGRLSQLEEQTNDSLAATADALDMFSQQLQDVVSRFAVAVREAEGDDDCVGTATAPTIASSSSAVVASNSGGGGGGVAIKSLEDVFGYFLHQLQQLQQALYRLQANTVETLEILEQHEESTAALPMLQHTVDAIAEALVPLAERLGVDATEFSLRFTSPHHNTDVCSHSRDPSDSLVSESKDTEALL